MTFMPPPMTRLERVRRILRLLRRGQWKMLWIWLRGPRFDKMTMPMVSRPFPPLIASEIVSVQPMTRGLDLGEKS